MNNYKIFVCISFNIIIEICIVYWKNSDEGRSYLITSSEAEGRENLISFLSSYTK